LSIGSQLLDVMVKDGVEVPDSDVRQKMVEFEQCISQIPGATIGDTPVCPLTHTFVDGAYVREIFMPKGMLITSKIHKLTHPYFILKGECSILTEVGIKRVKAPFYGITKAGTKRILYIHEDTTWITVHVTDETNLEKIEDEVIAPTFADLDKNIIDIKPEEIKLMEFMEEAKKEEVHAPAL
jgi:hypothetical protein